MKHIDTDMIRAIKAEGDTLIMISEIKDGQPVVRMTVQGDLWNPKPVTHIIELNAEDAQRVLAVTNDKDTFAELRIKSGSGKELMVQRASGYDEEGIGHQGYKVILGPEGETDWQIFVDTLCEFYVQDDHMRHFRDVLQHCIDRDLAMTEAPRPRS
jgi:hypothetical protein